MRTITVHINTAVITQLSSKLGSEYFMKAGGEIPERIAQRQFLFIGCQQVTAAWCMIDIRIIRPCFGQITGYALQDLGFEIVHDYGCFSTAKQIY
jgi:hypothetical protein